MSPCGVTIPASSWLRRLWSSIICRPNALTAGESALACASSPRLISALLPYAARNANSASAGLKRGGGGARADGPVERRAGLLAPDEQQTENQEGAGAG